MCRPHSRAWVLDDVVIWTFVALHGRDHLSGLYVSLCHLLVGRLDPLLGSSASMSVLEGPGRWLSKFLRDARDFSQYLNSG